MITLHQVSKRYKTLSGPKTVLDSVDFTVSKGEAVGICGHNGAGKSTLLRILAGAEHPDTGRVESRMTTSWPLGHSSAFQSSLSGADNTRFIARVYGLDPKETLDFVDDFAELGPYLSMPVRTYSSGMMARLAFGISLAVQFECYLIDEITAAGDARFQAKCHAALVTRKNSGALLMVSHDPHTLRDYCTTGAILRNGRLQRFDTIDEAIDRHFADSVAV
jgi:capsular polysaccharide transport system ATP-binding protein